MCVVLDDVSPQHNQSCGFCDAHRLNPTNLYTLTGCSDDHAEGKTGEDLFHYTTPMHRLSQFGASEDGILKICKHMKYTQKSNRLHAL